MVACGIRSIQAGRHLPGLCKQMGIRGRHPQASPPVNVPSILGRRICTSCGVSVATL